MDEINDTLDKFGVTVEAEVFLDKDKQVAGKRSKGSLGLDVIVRNTKSGRIVLAFDMKTGKSGTYKKKSKRYKERISGAPLIDIHIERKK